MDLKRSLRTGGGALLTMSAALCGADAGSWGRNNLWDDGRAEVAVYDAERVVYGVPRTYREQLVTVKEDLRADTLVKADQPGKTKVTRVFKLNQVQKFDTDNYPYSYLTSVFVKESELDQVVKLTVGSQEWCGNTFKLYKRSDQGGTLEWHSYFDGEADGETAIELKESTYFEDQLPLSLRELPFAEGFSKKITLIDPLTTSHGGAPASQEAWIKVETVEPIRCHAGSIPSWKVVVERPAARNADMYWFEKQYPNILTRMETADGRKRMLYARSRWSYWDRRLPRPNILN